jgi:hypothetical protein
MRKYIIEGAVIIGQQKRSLLTTGMVVEDI